jgi:hypothetical protein
MRQARASVVGVVLVVALALFAVSGFGLGSPTVQAGVLAAQGLADQAADLRWLAQLALGVMIAALLLGGLMGDVLGVWLLAEGLVLTAGGLLAFAFGADREALIAATAATAAGAGLGLVGTVPILVRWVEARARPVAHIVAAASLGLGTLALDKAAPWVERSAEGGGIDLNGLDMWAGIGALAMALLVLLLLGGGRAGAGSALAGRHGVVHPSRLLLASLLAGGAAAALQAGALDRALAAGALSPQGLSQLYVLAAGAAVTAPLVIVPVAAWAGPRLALTLLLPVIALAALAVPFLAAGRDAAEAAFTMDGVFLTGCYGLLVAIATGLVPMARPALMAGSALAAFQLGLAFGPFLAREVARAAEGPDPAAAATALVLSLLAGLALHLGARRPEVPRAETKRAGATA